MRLAWIVVPLCLAGCAAPRSAVTSYDFGIRNIEPPRAPSPQEELDAESQTKNACPNMPNWCVIEVVVEDGTFSDANGKTFSCAVKAVKPSSVFLRGRGVVRWRITGTSTGHQYRFPAPNSASTADVGIVVVNGSRPKYFDDNFFSASRDRILRLAPGSSSVLYHYNIEVVRSEVAGDVPCMLHDPIIINRP